MKTETPASKVGLRARRTVLSAGVAALTLAALPTLSVAAEPIKVGAVLSLTGPSSFLGVPAQRTLQLEVDKVNAAGGIGGAKVELVMYDDGGEASKSNAFTKRLIENDNVDAIIGGSSTGSTMSMIPLVEKAGVPFISLAGAVVIVEPVKKWVFKTAHTDRMVAERVLSDMKRRGYTRIGLLSDTSGFGVSGRKEVTQMAERLGVTVVADEVYGPKDTDMTTQLTKIRSAQGVQALFIFGFGQGSAVATRNVAQLGVKLPVYHSHGSASEEYIQLSGPAAEGTRVPGAAFLVANTLPDSDLQKPVSLKYGKEFSDRFSAPIDNFGGNAYDAAALLFTAMKAVGGADKGKVRDAIEKSKNVVGVNGIFNMTPTDHLGLKTDSLRLMIVKNGRFALED